VMETIAQHTVAASSEFEAQGISNLVWSFAVLQVIHVPVLDVLSASAAVHANSMESQAIANSVWAFATLRVHHSHFVAAISARVFHKPTEFDLPDLASIAWAFSDSSVQDAPVFAAISCALLLKAPLKVAGSGEACGASSAAVASILSALAQQPDFAQALQLYDELKAAAVGIPVLGIGVLLSRQEQEQVGAGGLIDVELQLLQELRPPGLRHAALGAAAVRLAETGQADDALRLARRLGKSEGDAPCLWQRVWRACGGELE